MTVPMRSISESARDALTDAKTLHAAARIVGRRLRSGATPPWLDLSIGLIQALDLALDEVESAFMPGEATLDSVQMERPHGGQQLLERCGGIGAIVANASLQLLQQIERRLASFLASHGTDCRSAR